VKCRYAGTPPGCSTSCARFREWSLRDNARLMAATRLGSSRPAASQVVDAAVGRPTRRCHRSRAPPRVGVVRATRHNRQPPGFQKTRGRAHGEVGRPAPNARSAIAMKTPSIRARRPSAGARPAPAKDRLGGETSPAILVDDSLLARDRFLLLLLLFSWKRIIAPLAPAGGFLRIALSSEIVDHAVKSRACQLLVGRR